MQELWKASQAAAELSLGHLLFKQLFTLSLSLEQMQLTWFKASHLPELLVTSATHAKRQAGGVANTWLEKSARATEERTVEVRITSGLVSVIDGEKTSDRLPLQVEVKSDLSSQLIRKIA